MHWKPLSKLRPPCQMKSRSDCKSRERGIWKHQGTGNSANGSTSEVVGAHSPTHVQSGPSTQKCSTKKHLGSWQGNAETTGWLWEVSSDTTVLQLCEGGSWERCCGGLWQLPHVPSNWQSAHKTHSTQPSWWDVRVPVFGQTHAFYLQFWRRQTWVTRSHWG